MVRSSLFFLIIFCIGLGMADLSSQLTLHKIFSDDMMLQADTSISIWGSASPKANVVVSIDLNQYTGRADKDGRWKVEIPPHRAGEQIKIRIESGEEHVALRNVLFGDIWLCGGQSNMEWFVEGAANPAEEIANANYPNIRIFDVPRRMSPLPLDDLEGGEWSECSSKSIPQFSAVGFYFGRTLANETLRPIGLIGNNYGGTIVEAWTSEEGLSDIDFYSGTIKDFQNSDLVKLKKEGNSLFDKWLLKFSSEDRGQKEGRYLWAKEDIETKSWDNIQLPALWESTKRKDLHEKDGVVWFTRTFELEETTEAVLCLGPIDDSDMTWINGILVGQTYNQYNKDRKYAVPVSMLNKGTNRVTIRVEDYVGGGGVYGDSEKLFLQLENNKVQLSGNWKYKIGMITNDAMPRSTFSPNNFPTSLFNGMIHPLIDFPIKGVIWYQGESNSYRAYEYRHLFPLLIQDWRRHWKINALPFLYVQLANFRAEPQVPGTSEWAELREAQEMALKLPSTAMITAIDIGDAKNIHPSNKQEVGRRLANAALSEIYQIKKPYQGPRFSKVNIKDNYIDITFENVGKGLMVDDKHGYVYGFTIAGTDRKYHWAKAEIIEMDRVRVWSENVNKPISVRYAWQDNPDPANLKNSHNLPAFPFRTDDYEISTYKIKRFE